MAFIYINITVFLALFNSLVTCYRPGYSYSKFSGPVSGPEQKIKVYDDGKYHHESVDYAAKPDYHFAYGVEDPKSKVLQSRQETRRGDAVKGEYSVLDPDGKYRTVKYTADKLNGFQAQIITDGNLHNVVQYPPAVDTHPYSNNDNSNGAGIEHNTDNTNNNESDDGGGDNDENENDENESDDSDDEENNKDDEDDEEYY